jgi:AcrR family transcriptional regulator
MVARRSPGRPGSGARERFIASAIVLLRSGGLAAAGVIQVTEHAKAPRGSLYHYFPDGKSQLVNEAIAVYQEQVSAHLAAALGSTAALGRRVEALFKGVAGRMEASGFFQSCAVGATVVDLTAAEESTQRATRDALAAWARTAEEHLREIEPFHRPRLARLLVTMLEGAQIAARAERNSRPLTEAAQAFNAVASGHLTKAPVARKAQHEKTLAGRARRTPVSPK